MVTSLENGAYPDLCTVTLCLPGGSMTRPGVKPSLLPSTRISESVGLLLTERVPATRASAEACGTFGALSFASAVSGGTAAWLPGAPFTHANSCAESGFIEEPIYTLTTESL